MKDIRIGNDILVTWSLFRGEEAYDLTNLPVTLYLKNAYGKKRVENYAVNGNQISWTFYGKDQKNTGKYSMVLVIREGEQGMASTDYCDFVQLVACACQVSGADDENVQTETLELNSEVDFPPIVVDTSLSEVSSNPIANMAVAKAFATQAESIKNKVDKVEGLGLSEENYTTKDKEKLARLENYDDSGIKGELAKKVDKEEGKGLSTNDYTDEDRAKLAGLEEELAKKADKEEGKGLSSNDFTNEDKIKVQMLQNGELEKRVDLGEFSLFARWMMTGDEDEPIKLVSSGIENRHGMLIARITRDGIVIPQELGGNLNLATLTERIDDLEVFIEDLQNTKIDKEADDYYPQLSVGLADNLAGVDVVDSKISFRRSGGGAISDGVARIEAIKGNSVVWNQKVRSALDSNGELGWWRRSSMDAIELSGNKVIIKPNQVSSGNSQQITQKVNFIANHKYLVIVDYAAPDDTICHSLEIHQQGDLVGNIAKRIASIPNPIKGHSESFHTAVADMPYLSIYFYEPTIFVSAEIEAKVIDLTLMFGVGNEPTTIDEFNARKPLGIDENAYKEGKVIHMDAQSLESVGVNQWDEQWESGQINNNGQDAAAEPSKARIRSKGYIRVLPNKEYAITHPLADDVMPYFYDNQYNFVKSGKWTNSGIPFLVPEGAMYMRFKMASDYGGVYKNDICVNLSDASVNGKYFPYIKRTQSLAIIGEGLKSAGTAHDEIRYNKATQKWEKVQRIGSVDMGSLNWRFLNESDGRWRFVVQLPLMKVFSSDEIANVLVSLFPTVTGWDVFHNIKEGMAVLGPNYLGIYNKRYEGLTHSEFKAAMQGIMLYYELAEHIVTELDDDFNLDYEVWNGGTEKILSDVPTTPLKADIAYGFNAVGKIKELEEKINNGGGGGGVSKDYVDGKLTELSAEVSGLSEGIALRNVGAEDTDESVDEPEIPAPTPSTSNEWKCVADRRMVEGEKNVIFTTYADGTPLKATELMVQLLNDKKSAQNITGYVGIKSTNNQNETIYGALSYEMTSVDESNQRLQQMRICASPFFTIAEYAPDVKCTVATPTTAYYQGGNLKTFQIYEDIVYVKISPNAALTSAAPYLKIYAR
jgi:hypothetical protein